MKIIETRLINRAEEGFFRYQGWPTVCKDENDVLYVGVSGHRLAHLCPFGTDLMYISRDKGKTWTPPMIINETKLDDRDVGFTYLGGERLLMSYFDIPMSSYCNHLDIMKKRVGEENYPLALAVTELWNKHPEWDKPGSFVRFSPDMGKTWNAPVQVPVSAPHGPIRLHDGSLFFLGKEFHSGDDTLEKGAIYAYKSPDEGKTWQYVSRVEFPDGCGTKNIHEPYSLELPDGTIIGMLRGDGSAVAHEFTIFSCFSKDGGKTWTKPVSLDFSGSPPHLLLHSSGKLILTYGRREPPDMGTRARVSEDGGKTWGEEILLSAGSKDDDHGYPSTVELSDGTLLTVFYQKWKDDDFASVCYTEWKL